MAYRTQEDQLDPLGQEEEGRIEDEAAQELTEEEINAKIWKLKKRVQANPFQYNLHLQFIGLLKQHKRSQDLRSAREKMAEIFPLTEDLWREWISDQKEAATTLAEKKELIDLYEKAVADYLSVQLWLDYVRYLLEESERMGEEEEEQAEEFAPISRIRETFERALHAAGAHYFEGSKLWKTFIEFEKILLSDVQDQAQQISRIRSLYHRFLKVHHHDYNQTVEDYAEWETAVDPETSEKEILAMKAVIEKTSAAIAERKPFEDELIQAEPQSTLAIFQKYADFEAKQKPLDPFAVKIIFERALKIHCLVPEVWIKYTSFLDQHLKVGKVVLSVYLRATRNCPWSSEIWCSYLRALERFHESPQVLDETYYKALGGGVPTVTDLVSIHLTYLDFRRRQIDWTQPVSKVSDQGSFLVSSFDQALANVNQVAPEGDPFAQIERYRARLEVRGFKDIDAAREIYDSILTTRGSSVDIWLEYINLERAHGDNERVRTLFKRASVLHPDWPEKLFGEWVTFERENGTLESFDFANEKIRIQMEIVEQRRLKEFEKFEQAQAPKKEKEKKRKREEGEGEKGGKPEKAQGGFKVPELPRKKQKQQVVVEEEEAEEDVKMADAQPQPLQQRVNPYDVEETKEFTVFLSNLSFKVTQELLSQKFSSCGKIKEIRLQIDKDGNSKGYAHIEFFEKEGVEKALKKDRELVEGRPVFVSRWSTKRRGEKAAPLFSASEDPKTIYVSNIHLTASEDDLKAIFAQAPGLKEVRLVRKKNGQSRGFAYIEYETPEGAKQAVNLDQTVFASQALSVALSNPKAKGSPTDSVSFGRGKNALALMPRTVAVQKSESPPPAPAAAEKKGPMSNDDFRKLLLQPKKK